MNKLELLNALNKNRFTVNRLFFLCEMESYDSGVSRQDISFVQFDTTELLREGILICFKSDDENLFRFLPATYVHSLWRIIIPKPTVPSLL